MSGGYIICEYDAVKKEFPEFQNTLQKLENEMILKASNDWAPLTFGGIAPKSGQFGETTIMPQLFQDMSGTRFTTWDQYLSTVGHQTIIQGVNTGGVIPEDYKIGFAGLAFLDKAVRISEVKYQISDHKLGRVNIEEALAYEKPAIIFEDGFILDEETGFHLYAYVTTLGYQKISLLGLQLNRVPNKLQVTNTGAAM